MPTTLSVTMARAMYGRMLASFAVTPLAIEDHPNLGASPKYAVDSGPETDVVSPRQTWPTMFPSQSE
jgi:hypothetical protein